MLVGVFFFERRKEGELRFAVYNIETHEMEALTAPRRHRGKEIPIEKRLLMREDGTHTNFRPAASGV